MFSRLFGGHNLNFDEIWGFKLFFLYFNKFIIYKKILQKSGFKTSHFYKRKLCYLTQLIKDTLINQKDIKYKVSIKFKILDIHKD